MKTLKTILFISILLLAFSALYADEEKVIFDGPWKIEKILKLKDNVPGEGYLQITQMKSYNFSLSPDEKWLLFVMTYEKKYLIGIFNIETGNLYTKEIKSSEDYFHWKENCFKKDSSVVFIDGRMIKLSEDMKEMELIEDKENYNKRKGELTSLDDGKYQDKDAGVAYSGEWAWSRDGEILYEENHYDVEHLIHLNSILRITPPGKGVDIDYSDIIKEKVNRRNEIWLHALDNDTRLFNKQVDTISEVSDKELKLALKNQDKVFGQMMKEERCNDSRNSLERKLLFYKEINNWSEQEQKFINDFYANIDLDLDKLAKEKIIQLIEKMEDGLTRIRRGTTIEEMSRDRLLNELYFIVPSNVWIFLECLSPSPDGKWLSAVLDSSAESEMWPPFSSGPIPYGVLIDLREVKPKPIKYAKDVAGQQVWSNDSKRLYFCADGNFYRLSLKV